MLASPTSLSGAGALPQELGHWFCTQNLQLSTGIAFGNDCQMTSRSLSLDSNLNSASWLQIVKILSARKSATNCVEFEFFLGQINCVEFEFFQFFYCVCLDLALILAEYAQVEASKVKISTLIPQDGCGTITLSTTSPPLGRSIFNCFIVVLVQASRAWVANVKTLNGQLIPTTLPRMALTAPNTILIEMS